MKKISCFALLILFSAFFTFAQSNNTRVFTIFTSYGCGCTGSGGAPETFTTHEEVMEELRESCTGIDFIEWEGNHPSALAELTNHKNSYDGVLIIGRLNGDYRLAFTGLPTIVVYNLFEFMDAQPYHLFATGKMPEESVLKGGKGYTGGRILTAQLDRRNLASPAVREAMFNDLVDKIRLIQVVKELRQTRILMIKNHENETIASVNYRGDHNQSFPEGFNETYLSNFTDLFGVEIVTVEPHEFFEAYQTTDIRKAEEIADEWVSNARKVTASMPEIVKTARAYLAMDELREKYDCNAVSTHIRTVSGSGELAERFWPGVALELGFKTRGIMAVCQNYPDLLISQVLAYLMTGRPSMLADFMYDIHNSTEIVLHSGIPINPYGDERRVPYSIVPHAESPVRDIPEEPGSSTGLTAEWPEGETVTLWEIHSLLKRVRLHTGEIVDGHAIYTGGEDLDDVMCTAKIIVKHDDIKKIQREFQPYLYGIHLNATLGDMREQLKDIAVFLGLDVIETDR